MKYYLSEEIIQLEKDIKDIETNKKEHEYWLNTAPLLCTYYDNLERITNEKDDNISIPKKNRFTENHRFFWYSSQ